MSADPVSVIHAAFFLIFGFGLLGVCYQSLSKGSLITYALRLLSGATTPLPLR